MEADIYGMIPKPKMEALLNAPPRKVSIKPKIPSGAAPNLEGSTPGRTMKEPNLKMIRKPIVFRILTLRSSIEKIFLTVEINFFIYLNLVYRTPKSFNRCNCSLRKLMSGYIQFGFQFATTKDFDFVILRSNSMSH